MRKVCQRVAPGGAGAGPHLLEPGFVPPPQLTPPPPAPSLLERGCILATSLALLVRGNAPFPVVPAPSFACRRPKGTSWPCTTPPPPNARFGDSGESVGPRPTPERGRPPSRLPGSAHAKACCVIPTWADIPCPGRSGVGLLIILSAADPRHQPIYCPVFPG